MRLVPSKGVAIALSVLAVASAFVVGGYELAASRLPPTYTVSLMSGRMSKPFLTVPVGAVIRWSNGAPGQAKLIPAPDSPSFSNTIRVPAGGTTLTKMSTPGLYVFVDSRFAHWTVSNYSHTSVEGPLGLPNPNKGSPHYPYADFGAIAVVGPSASAPTSAVVALPWNYYDPAYVVLRAGGTVTWQSLSHRTLGATTVAGLAPQPFNESIKPFAVTKPLRLTKPGLYVYDSTQYVHWNRQLGLPLATKSADIYPIAQVGIIAVLPR